MKKLLCPQCKIAGMYVKNDQGERLLVYIAQDGTVVPKYPEIPIEGSILRKYIVWAVPGMDRPNN